MRKFFAVFLLLVFLLNLTGIFIVFNIQRSLIRNEVMQLLQHPRFEKELAIITVTSDNEYLFEWEDEKEFRYKGVMYDCVKKELNSKGELVLHSIADKKETKLWNNLANLVKKNNPSHQVINNLVKLLSSAFLSTKKIIVDFFSDSSSIYFCSSILIPLAESEVSSPPPKPV